MWNMPLSVLSMRSSADDRLGQPIHRSATWTPNGTGMPYPFNSLWSLLNVGSASVVSHDRSRPTCGAA